MVKLIQYIADQDNKYSEQFKIFSESIQNDKRKAEKFYDIEFLKSILSQIDELLIGAGSDSKIQEHEG